MKKMFFSQRGFTLTEVLFVLVITVFITGTVISAWIFTNRTLTGEGEQTALRIDLLSSLETIKNDIRRSSGTYMSFYPMNSGVYTAVSMPYSDTAVDEFYPLNDEGKIDWDQVIVYHVVESQGDDGEIFKTLRRTAITWDSQMDPGGAYDQADEEKRYDLIDDVVGGTVSGAQNDDLIKSVLDFFEISTSAPVVDFYEDSTDPVKVRNVVFGYAYVDNRATHTIRFTVDGKYEDSSGYGFGIDSIRIVPSGSTREAEYYYYSSNYSSSGSTVNRYYDSIWGNNSFIEYAASAPDAWIQFSDGYDLWRESSFDNAALNNVLIYGDEDRAKLEVPEDRQSEGKKLISWSAEAQVGQASQEGVLPGYPVVIRTILKSGALDSEADAVRVSFSAPSSNPVRIERAYITRKQTAADDSDPDGSNNLNPSGLEIWEYHRHQQLSFSEADAGYDMNNDGDSSDILDFACIKPGDTVWSTWTGFPVELTDDDDNDLNYLISVYVPNLEAAGIFPSGWAGFDAVDDNCVYWQGDNTQSFYVLNGGYTTAGIPSWSSIPLAEGDYTTLDEVYYVSELDTWQKEGTAESRVFDTGLSSPTYGTMEWEEDSPSGTQVTVKARASGNENMVGAPSWGSVGSGSIGGSGSYLQSLATLSTDLYWYADTSTQSYGAYISAQIGGAGAPYAFPESGGEPYITGWYSTWVDDVTVEWGGDQRICVIMGDIARKDDYGQVKISVDGVDLVKVLKVDIGCVKDFHGRIITQQNIVEVEPQNTGK